MERIRKDKREAILQAALALIAENGFHHTPTAMIAEHASVAVGTIYRYFESKDELINALYKEIEGKYIKSIIQGYDRERPLRERFFHIGTNTLKYLIKNPMELRFIEHFHNSPYGIAVCREKIFSKTPSGDNSDILKELFEQGRAQQVIKELPLVVFFALFFPPLVALAKDHTLGFFDLDQDLMELAVASCWDAVKL